MACNTLLEILKTCDGNLGGVVKFWINNADAIDPSTVTIDTAAGKVTAAELEATADPFVEFQFNPNTSNFTEAIAVDLTNGSTFYNQAITLSLNRREGLKRQRLMLIALGQPELTCIVLDSNGIYWVFGIQNDKVFFTGSEGGSGTTKADQNGYVLTFTCEDAESALEIDEAVVTALTATTSSP